MYARWKTSATKHKQYFTVTKWADQPPERKKGDPLVWKALETGMRTRKPDYVKLSAVLVESKRIDGAPRQKLVRWLATIRADEAHQPWARFHFWNTVEERTGDLDEVTRAGIFATLARKVERLPLDEYASMNATYHAMIDDLRAP